MFTDWLAVSGLLTTYAEYVDAGQFAAAAELFADATYRVVRDDGSVSMSYEGAAQVEDFFASTTIYADGTPLTKHLITNVNIEIDGDHARARSYVTVLQQTEVLPLQPIASGTYVDEFTRIDGRWRFTDRLVTRFLLGDRSQHIDWHADAPPGTAS